MCAFCSRQRDAKRLVNALSYVTVTWSVIAASALLLGLLHFTRWTMDRQARADLTFSIVAFAFVADSIAELQSLLATTPAEWAAWIRLSHLPLGIMVIGTVMFVRQFLGAGRLWLAVAIIAIRVVIVALNFGSSAPNFNFAQVETLSYVELLGERVATVGEATTGRWQVLGVLSTAMLTLFVLDAAISLWRRGGEENRRRAAIIGGGVFLFVTLAGINSQLVIYGLITGPFLITPSFTVAMLAMAFELSRDALRGARLARDLEVSRRRLELAADAGKFGLCEWDTRANRVWSTRRAQEIFGLPPAESDTLDAWLERIHPADAQRVRDQLQDALTVGREIHVEFRVCPRGSAVRWISAWGRAEGPGIASPSRLHGVIQDVSEQHEALRETLDLRRELAHVGRVSALGQLASSLAHELSQPLGAILRNAEAAEMLLGSPAPDHEELKAIVADIHRDDRRAGDVIDRMRALLKRRQLDMQPIALDALVADVRSLVRADALSRHVAIDWSVQAGLPVVPGDRVHLSQVLINLIMNAMDAVMERPAPDRRVDVYVRRAERGAIEMCVLDCGPGIAAEDLGHIFEPFYTTKSAGMGIGLAVCRTIVNAHGGTLTAANHPSGGALFTVLLPAPAGRED